MFFPFSLLSSALHELGFLFQTLLEQLEELYHKDPTKHKESLLYMYGFLFLPSCRYLYLQTHLNTLGQLLFDNSGHQLSFLGYPYPLPLPFLLDRLGNCYSLPVRSRKQPTQISKIKGRTPSFFYSSQSFQSPQKTFIAFIILKIITYLHKKETFLNEMPLFTQNLFNYHYTNRAYKFYLPRLLFHR